MVKRSTIPTQITSKFSRNVICILRDFGKSATLHSVWPLTYKPQHIFFIIAAAIYALITILLFLTLLRFATGMELYLPFLSFLAYIVYFYVGGYVYKMKFKNETYKFYVYICVLSVVYSPIDLFLCILLKPYWHGMISFLLFIMHMTFSYYIVSANIKNEVLSQRDAVIRYMVVWATQFVGLFLISHAYYRVAFLIW